MDHYFLDSSAIAKRYVSEPGQRWVQDLCVAGHILYVSELATVEVVNVIYKRTQPEIQRSPQRRRRHLIEARTALINTFKQHCDPTTGDYIVRVLTVDTYRLAQELVSTSGIASLDALQLASMLILSDEASRSGAPVPCFVSADTDLLGYARRRSQGGVSFAIENPHDHIDPTEVERPYGDWRAQIERLALWLYRNAQRLNRG